MFPCPVWTATAGLGLLEDLRGPNEDKCQLMGGRYVKVSVHCLVNYMVSPRLPAKGPGHTSLRR